MSIHSCLHILSRMLIPAAVLVLTACNDDDALRDAHGDHDHEAPSSGRLVIGDANGAASRALVHDLDTGTTVASLPLRHAPTALYASPGGRYAVVVQAADGLVSFVDGGVWLHDDHVHADTPTLLAFERSGAKPAHYQVHEDQAALFYDGEGDTPAGFDLLTDASLAVSQIVARATLPVPVHGVAQPRDGAVLAVDYSAAEAAGGVPRSAVKHYQLHGDHFHDEGRFATPCDNLHGSAGNEDYTAFGCTDGVLLIQQDGETFTDRKLSIGQRITQMAGHHAVEVFAGFASDGTLYVIDPATDTATPFDWNGAAADVGIRQYRFDAHGEHLLILDRTGMLHVLEAHGDHFDRKAAVQVLAADDSAARITTSGADDLAFVTDPAGMAVVVVDLATVDIVDHVDLDFAPTGITWLGIAPDADHDHDHEHDHDH